MSLPHGLLGLLSYKDMTGYELSKTFSDSLAFFWSAQPAQIYRELNRMQKYAWLTSKLEIQTDKPNKRIYSITAEGKKELEAWLRTDMPTCFLPAKNYILMRMFFSGKKSAKENIAALNTICTNYEKQFVQIGAASKAIDEYSVYADSENDPFYWQLCKDFGQMYAKMCVQWALASIEKIKARGAIE